MDERLSFLCNFVDGHGERARGARYVDHEAIEVDASSFFFGEVRQPFAERWPSYILVNKAPEMAPDLDTTIRRMRQRAKVAAMTGGTTAAITPEEFAAWRIAREMGKAFDGTSFGNGLLIRTNFGGTVALRVRDDVTFAPSARLQVDPRMAAVVAFLLGAGLYVGDVHVESVKDGEHEILVDCAVKIVGFGADEVAAFMRAIAELLEDDGVQIVDGVEDFGPHGCAIITGAVTHRGHSAHILVQGLDDAGLAAARKRAGVPC